MHRLRWIFLTAVAVILAGNPAAAAVVAPRMLLLDGVLAGPAVVAVGEGGTILRSTDSGSTWEESRTGTHATLTGVSFAPSGRHGWAVGHDAIILTTDDGGVTWRKSWQGENLEQSFLDVLALDEKHVLAVGAYGFCLETTDGGATWVPRHLLDEDMHLNRVSRGPAGTLYLAGERGTLLRSRDSGRTWVRLSSDYTGSFYGILPLDATTLLAHGLRGRLYRSTDDGETWTLVPVPQPTLIATALAVAPGRIFFAGQSRGLYASTDGGETVFAWSAPLTSAVAELLRLPDGRILALGEAGFSLVPPP